MGAGGGGDPVAGAVDVDQLPRLRHGVDAGEVDLGLGGLGQGGRPWGAPVPVDGVALGQGLVQAQVLQGHAAPQADGLAGPLGGQPVLGGLAGGEGVDGKPRPGEGFLQ